MFLAFKIEEKNNLILIFKDIGKKTNILFDSTTSVYLGFR